MADSPTLSGQTIRGRLRILEPLGDGGMGAVYRAVQLHLRREVAVKVIRPERAGEPTLVKRFEREMQATARIQSPHVVHIYEYGTTEDGALFASMELIDGPTLAEVIRRSGPLPVRRVIRLGAQIARALEAAHTFGIVHRDLKPSNVMLTTRPGESDYVKVVDFGIATFLEDSAGEQKHRITSTGLVVGTPGYCSPEQARGEEVDPRSDLYALGCLLFHAATGRPPFDARTPLGVLYHQVNTAPARLDAQAGGSGAAELGALVSQLLEKQPEKRPATATAVRERLEALLGRPAPAPRVSTTQAWDKEAVPPNGPETSRWAPAALAPSVDARPAPGPRPSSRLAIGLALLLGATLSSVGAWWLLDRLAHQPGVAAPASGEQTSSMGAAPTPMDAPTPGAAAVDVQVAEPDVGPVEPEPDIPVAEVVVAAPAVVTVRVTSRPSAATVRRGKEVLGRTPLDLEVVQGTGGTLKISRSGYVTQRVRYDGVDGEALVVLLRKREKTVPRVEPPPPAVVEEAFPEVLVIPEDGAPEP